MPMLERPFELAGKRLRNRIVHVSITTLAARDGKVSKLEYVYIRGSKIRFMIVPDMLKV